MEDVNLHVVALHGRLDHFCNKKNSKTVNHFLLLERKCLSVINFVGVLLSVSRLSADGQPTNIIIPAACKMNFEQIIRSSTLLTR